uniref:hypothetical protein n=1 Tax=Limnohabitans sp. TaxID=1907725 RepID=UPI0040475864
MRLRYLYLFCLLTILASLPVSAAWSLHEETNVKGTITGTIKKGTIIKMVSGSVYEVTQVTIMVVVEVMPEAVVLKEGDQFKLIIEGFDEPLICKQLVLPSAEKAIQGDAKETTQRSSVPSSKDLPLEKLMSTVQQRQAGVQKLTPKEKERLRIHLINTYLFGVKQGGKGQADASSSEKKPDSTPPTIESQIDGEFEGWEGETIVKLTNGQIWQQTEYHYHYHYAYMPKVLIYRSGSGYKMKVDGIERSVGVVHIK